MLQARKAQTFNDGNVRIYKVNRQTRELIFLNTLRYHERTIGYNRLYKALERDIRVDLLLRCPALNGIPNNDTDILIAIPKDGLTYKIMTIQHPEDVYPPVMDLSLEKTSDYSDIAMASYAELNCQVDVYSKTESENSLGELCYVYSKLKTIWAQIEAVSGTVKDEEGDIETAQITHKITIKGDDVELTSDMYFIFENTRYDIKYYMKNYKYMDRLEAYCNAVIE